MKISPALAQEIVDSLKVTLRHKVNFMDMAGLIIASSDPNRINTFHEGAAQVIKTGQALLIDSNEQYKGTKKGINMPIYFDHDMIGVVGLTGEKEVKNYAQILKSMTEILIKEAYLNTISLQKREKQRLQIESLLLHSTNVFKEYLFDLDLEKPYRVVVASAASMEEQTSTLLWLLESSFHGQSDVLFTISRSRIILLMPNREVDVTLKKIQSTIHTRLNLSLNFGVGNTGIGHVNIRESFKSAKQALNWLQVRGKEGHISYFEKLDLGMLLCNIPDDVRRLFLVNTLQGIPSKEIKVMNETLATFAKHNGSIGKCAEDLFIHKNTVQYKLNKIKSLTGYDPRNYQDFAILHLAFQLLEMKENDPAF